MKFRDHQYIWQKPYSTINHQWSLVGSEAAISFHASQPENGKGQVVAGLECHYFHPPAYMKDDPPSVVNCPFTGGRCWHDGTSLYAMETLWPRIDLLLKEGDHSSIFRILEHELERRIKAMCE